MARIDQTDDVNKNYDTTPGTRTTSRTTVARSDNSGAIWIILIVAAIAVIAAIYAFSGADTTDRAITTDPAVTTTPSTTDNDADHPACSDHGHDDCTGAGADNRHNDRSGNRSERTGRNDHAACGNGVDGNRHHDGAFRHRNGHRHRTVTRIEVRERPAAAPMPRRFFYALRSQPPRAFCCQ